jgi:putative PIN family toxin of toxin-antitoxin system
MRSKFDRYVNRAVRQRFLADLASVAEWVTIMGGVDASRDPADDKFLETAMNGEADCIVTGDADLLTLDPFRGVRILTPRGFLGAVRRARGD